MEIQESKPENQDRFRNVPLKKKEPGNETKPPTHHNLQIATVSHVTNPMIRLQNPKVFIGDQLS